MSGLKKSGVKMSGVKMSGAAEEHCSIKQPRSVIPRETAACLHRFLIQ